MRTLWIRKNNAAFKYKKEIRPRGVRKGSVRFMGTDVKDLDEGRSACEIGFLFQNPDDQIVSDTVLQEIAFPLENIGLPTAEIRNRVAEMAAFLDWINTFTKTLMNCQGAETAGKPMFAPGFKTSPTASGRTNFPT